jgi:Na+:H+ antiporter
VGQLLVGVVLGPSLLAPYDGLYSLSPGLTAIQLLGTVIIVFMAGLYVTPGEIMRGGKPALALGVAIFVVPFSITCVIARFLLPSGDGLLPLFLGLTISITALPVMGVMLAEFGLLRDRIGTLLMDSALVNELIAVSAFAVLLRLTGGGPGISSDLAAIGSAAVSLAIFLGAIFGIYFVLRRLGRDDWWRSARVSAGRRIHSREAGLALVMVCLLFGSLFSQYLGLTYIVGAFYAGVLVSEGLAGLETRWSVDRIFEAMSWGLFLPLFFAFVGVEMNVRLLGGLPILLFLVVLTGVAVLTKVGTGYSVARLLGWSPSDSLAIGHLTSSRGAVGLVMAVVLLSDGVFTPQVFTVVAAVGLVTSLLAPIGARRAWRTRGEGPTPSFSAPIPPR